MDQPYNRISENVLFALLLTALVAWLTVPMASDLPSASAARACLATIAGAHGS
jgi:hypothetical protein